MSYVLLYIYGAHRMLLNFGYFYKSIGQTDVRFIKRFHCQTNIMCSHPSIKSFFYTKLTLILSKFIIQFIPLTTLNINIIFHTQHKYIFDHTKATKHSKNSSSRIQHINTENTRPNRRASLKIEPYASEPFFRRADGRLSRFFRPTWGC